MRHYTRPSIDFRKHFSHLALLKSSGTRQDHIGFVSATPPKLEAKLREEGYPSMYSRKGIWEAYLDGNNGFQQKAYGILQDVAGEFDNAYHTNFLSAFNVNYLLGNFTKVNW